jgi:hypothetical protein
VGLYGGDFTGTGFTSMTFELTVDGTVLIDKTFTTAVSAKAIFTHDAFNFASLVTSEVGNSTLQLTASMSITGASRGAGFHGNIVVVDAPTTTVAVADALEAATSASGRFVQGMAAFGTQPFGAGELTGAAQPRSELLFGATSGRRDPIAAHRSMQA